jgi:hypothetical protein
MELTVLGKSIVGKRAMWFALGAVMLCTCFSSDSAAQGQSVGSAASLTPELRTKADHLSNLQKNFSNTKNMNGPGVKLSLKEVERTKTADRTLVMYRLYAEGLPKDKIYTLFQIQIDGSIVKNLEGVTLDSAGQAVCAGRERTCQGDAPNDPIDLVVFASKSEAKRFALVSDDNAQTKGFVSVQPFPNVSTDKACKLESVLGTPNGELTFIQATGFEPNSALTINSQSFDEKLDYTAKADTDGTYFAALLPGVSGKKSGKTVVEVKSANCSPKLYVQWGENSYHLE